MTEFTYRIDEPLRIVKRYQGDRFVSYLRFAQLEDTRKFEKVLRMIADLGPEVTTLYRVARDELLERGLIAESGPEE